MHYALFIHPVLSGNLIITHYCTTWPQGATGYNERFKELGGLGIHQ
jgi:hypothetical protein